jgi:hypothetical protein
VGPHCPGASTVEVAYALRPFPQLPEGVPPLSRCVIIPEPSLWEPGQTYSYQAIVELWEGGRLCDRAQFEYGLRMGRGSPEVGSV